MEIVLCISICNSPGTLGLWSMMFTRLLISVYIFILALCAKKIVFWSNFHEKLVSLIKPYKHIRGNLRFLINSSQFTEIRLKKTILNRIQMQKFIFQDKLFDKINVGQYLFSQKMRCNASERFGSMSNCENIWKCLT